MKKLIALLLCTVLLAGMTVCFAASDTWTCESCGRESSGKFCPYCGAAKPEEVIFPEAPAGTFSIRNGIRWGMSGYEGRQGKQTRKVMRRDIIPPRMGM